MHVADKAYQEHKIFSDLQRYIAFYKNLSRSIFSFITLGTKCIFNIDTYTYSSIQGTIESIKTTLVNGRINDAYTLLRKYYDSAIINIYSNIYLHDNFRVDNFIVDKINNWVQGTERLPAYKHMNKYILESKMLTPINNIFYSDHRYKVIRDRCNDHTHYNFYQYMMLNDKEVYIKDRYKWLNEFSSDIQNLFILHVGYILFLNTHYMMSSDYTDALECGIHPEEDSQYWVAPFIQKIFDEVITPQRPELTAAIKSNSAMQLS